MESSNKKVGSSILSFVEGILTRVKAATASRRTESQDGVITGKKSNWNMKNAFAISDDSLQVIVNEKERVRLSELPRVLSSSFFDSFLFP